MSRSRPRGRSLLAAVGLSFALVAVACGSGDSEGVSIGDPWARPTPEAATNGAAYMEVDSGTADQIIGAKVDSSIADHAELHETTGDMDMSDGDMDMSGGGMMGMEEVPEIEVPADETVAIEPGGYHVMLIDLADRLEEGESFDLTLQFAEAGEQTVNVEVGQP